MSDGLSTQNWAKHSRRALSATEVVTRLVALEGWQLSGDGPAVAIEKQYRFANFHDTMAFVNAVAFIAHRQDHHPELQVHYNRCVVRFNTHDVSGISTTDFGCAVLVDALLAPGATS